MYTRKQKIEVVVLFLLAVIAIELFTVFISQKGVQELYHTQKAVLPWAMPLHLLIPIWTVLFIMIGISGALLWVKPHSHIRSFAMWAWVTQLVINVLWPICFFYVPIEILTPVLITILFMTVVILMFYSYMVSTVAAILLFPYLLMIIYKMIFHWIFYILNIQLL